MTEEPIDRHEHVHVSPHHEERVIHDASAERRQLLTQITHFIWLVAAVIEVLILLRIFLKLIAANPLSPFAAVIYGVTDVLLFPFFGLTATPTLGNGMVLEITSLFAMVVYFFGFWILAKAIWLMFERPSARTVTTIEAQPDTVVQERVVVEERPAVEREVFVEEEPEAIRRVVRTKRIRDDEIIR